MTHSPDALIEEIIALEPALANYRAELKKIVAELVDARPDTTIDRAFVARLREQLIERASARKQSIISLLFAPAVRYAGIGALATALIVTPVMYHVLTTAPSSQLAATDTYREMSGTQITQLAPRAFGDLATGTSGMGRGGGGGGMGGGVVAPMATESATTDMDAKRMIAPGEPTPGMPPMEITTYRYVYDGALPEIPKDVTVYKRDKTLPNPAGLEEMLPSLGYGLIDLSGFRDVKLQNLSLVEDREGGLAVAINPMDGGISINPNYQKWPNPLALCRDEACTQANRVKIDQIPSDEKVLAAAKKFVNEYGIDVAGYGTPVVDRTWRTQYEQAADKTSYWLPEQIGVIYPTLIDGKPIREEWNEAPAGLQVMVDVRTGTAVSLFGLVTQRYSSSDYPVASDELVKDAVAKGGQYEYRQDGATYKTIDVTLGTPTTQLVKIWAYDEKTGMGDELYVPSLIFPVTKKPDGDPYFRSTVVIPLAAEVLEKRIHPNIGGPITIQPVDVAEPAASVETTPAATDTTKPADTPVVDKPTDVATPTLRKE